MKNKIVAVAVLIVVVGLLAIVLVNTNEDTVIKKENSVISETTQDEDSNETPVLNPDGSKSSFKPNPKEEANYDEIYFAYAKKDNDDSGSEDNSHITQQPDKGREDPISGIILDANETEILQY